MRGHTRTDDEGATDVATQPVIGVYDSQPFVAARARAVRGGDQRELSPLDPPVRLMDVFIAGASDATGSRVTLV